MSRVASEVLALAQAIRPAEAMLDGVEALGELSIHGRQTAVDIPDEDRERRRAAPAAAHEPAAVTGREREAAIRFLPISAGILRDRKSTKPGTPNRSGAMNRKSNAPWR